MNEPITTAAVTTAVTAPWWLPYLTEFNLVAAALLTIATIAWLVTQTWAKLREDWRKNKEFKHKYEIRDKIQSPD